MELLEFILGGVALIILAVILFTRAFNTSIARWIAQVPQIAQGAVSQVKLPSYKIKDVLAYGAMQTLQDPAVKKGISEAIASLVKGITGQQPGPPPPPPEV